MTCVLNDRFHEKGTALAAAPQQPEPEIGSLAGSSDCTPNTSDQREVGEITVSAALSRTSTASYGPRSPSMISDPASRR